MKKYQKALPFFTIIIVIIFYILVDRKRSIEQPISHQKIKNLPHHHVHNHKNEKSNPILHSKSEGKNLKKIISEEVKSNNRVYKNQISYFKKTYFRHLSKEIDVSISVKKVLKNKIIILVRTKNKDGTNLSFESIIDRKTGKKIVNQNFTTLENRKSYQGIKLSPTGLLINKK